MDEFYNRFNYLKCLAWRDRIDGIISGNFQAPVVWHIYPSNLCPFRCTFCIMQREKEGRPVMLSRDTLMRAVDDCIANDVKLIHFSGGGEPLTHPDLPEAMDKAAAAGVELAMSTNGLLIKDPARLVRNLRHLRISVNSGSPEMHQKIHRTPKPVFDRVLENIRQCVRYKQDTNIGMAFVICPENWTDIHKFVERAVECGVDFVHLRPAYLKDDEGLRLVLPEVFRICEQAKRDFGRFVDIFSIKYKFDGYWDGRKYDKCRATPLSAVLGADGWLRICQDVLDPPIGDYNNHDFWDIWGSDQHKAVLDQINLDECPRCVCNKQNEIIENVFMKDRMRMCRI